PAPGSDWTQLSRTDRVLRARRIRVTPEHADPIEAELSRDRSAVWHRNAAVIGPETGVWRRLARSGDAGDPFADRGHQADPLVTGYERRGRLDRPVAVGCAYVGMAQAGSFHPDGYCPRAADGTGRSSTTSGWLNSRTTVA